MSTRSRGSARCSASARTVALAAALLATGAVLGLAEAVFLPPLPVPGVRLGLANVAVVLALVLLDERRALGVGLGRVFVVGLATGSLGGPGTLMATAGCVAAWFAMTSLARCGERFSPVGWSVGGAAAHVVAQLIVACVLAGTAAPLVLLPLSLGLSLPAGLATGHLARTLLSRVPQLEAAVGR